MHAVYVFQAELGIVNGISSNQSLTWRCIDLGESKLIDLRFLDATTLVLLCTGTGNLDTIWLLLLHLSHFANLAAEPSNPAIFTVPVQSTDAAALYEPYTEDAAPESIPGLPLAAAGGTEYHLPEACAMRPVRMEVHSGHDVRGQIPARICLLASNRTTWRTFILDNKNAKT